MKRQKRLLILSGILVVCVGGTVAVSQVNFEEKMSEKETAIIDIESGDITRLSWNYEEEVSFARQDGEWKYETDDKMAVDQELLDEIAENLSQITSLDCVQKEEIPEMESISSVSVDKEEAVDMVYKEESGYCYSDAYTYYLQDGEEYRNLDNENTENTFTTLSEFSWEECVDYYAEDPSQIYPGRCNEEQETLLWKNADGRKAAPAYSKRKRTSDRALRI